MPVTSQTEENKTVPEGSETNGSPPETVVEIAAAATHVEEERAGAPSLPQQAAKKSRAARWLLLLMIVGLVGAGYAYRARLLRLVTKDTASTTQTAERKVLYWVDPMHPAYKSDKPGTAPDCGMDLVPVYESGNQTASNLPPGTIQINPERQQLIGVQYGQAAYRTVAKTLRTVGRLAYDETRVTHVHTKYEGWIEDVFVDFTGKLVNKGQPLVTIYSPELLQTQQEFLLARRGRAELSDSPFREAVYGANSLYEAARKRLELWDLTEEQIKELERSGKPTRALPLLAPNNGFVTARNAFKKQRVTPETELYTIADLASIWVVADIYEFEAAEIKLGQTALVTLTYFPGRRFRGKVTYIYPQLDNTTRTLKVRVEVSNPGFVLKPDMYANVELMVNYGRHVVVPQEAVLDSGAEQQVFVAREGGYFEPRRVEIGAKVDTDVIVLSGLKAGEMVVTSANFLIDSESKLKSATGGMGAPGGHGHGGTAPSGGAQPSPTDHSKHGQSEPTPSPSVDHSKHQPQGKSRKQEHNEHQPEGNGHSQLQAAPEDHSQHAEAAAAHERDHSKQSSKILYYYCPMHTEQRSDKPRMCPKCKMRLIPQHAGAKDGER
jgi:membrane fusion protein, copper/silver efflux system